MERRLDEGKSIDVHSVASFFVSRVDTEVDKRLEALGRDGPARHRGGRQRARRLHALQGDLPRRALRGAARRRRPRAAPALGVDRRRRTRSYPETKYVDKLVGPHTVNTMPMPTLLAVRRAQRGHGRHGRPGPDARSSRRSREAGIDMDDVTKKLLRTASSVHRAVRRSCSRASSRRARRVVTGRPKTIESAIPDELEPAIAERVEARARARTWRGAIWRQDETLWGGPGVPEIGNRLGWLTIAEQDARAARTSSTSSPTRCEADGLTDVVLLGMGGSILGARGDPALVRRRRRRAASCTCSTRPTRARSRPSSSEVDLEHDAVPRLVEVRRDDRDALAVRATSRAQRSATASHFVAITDPGSPLVELGRGARLPRACSRTTRTSAGATRRCRTSGSCRRRWRASTSRRCSSARRWPSENCQHYDPAERTRACGWAARSASWRCAGRDKLTFVVDEPIASFGLWVEQLIAESTGKQGKGILPVADEPLGDAGRLRRRPRVRPPAQRGRAGRGHDAGVEALAEAGHPTITLQVRRARGPRAGSSSSPSSRPPWPAGCSSINPFDQPNVQEAKDDDQRRCSRRALAGAADATATLDELLEASAPPHYVAIHGLRRSRRRSSTRRSPSCARRSATRRRRRRRSATGRATCTRPGSSTRAGRRPACSSSSSTTATRTSRSRAPATRSRTLKNAQAIGDLQTLQRARPAGARDPRSRATRRRRPRPDQGRSCLMQIGFVGLGQDGRQHGPPHPARLGPRGRRVRLQRGGGEQAAEGHGAAGAGSLEELVAKLERAAQRSGSWCPAGDPTQQTVDEARRSCSTRAT